MSTFLKYLESIRPIINWADIGRRSGIGPRAFAKHFGGFQPLSERRYADVARVLCESLGTINIGGNLIEYETGAFYVTTPTGKEATVIENVDENGNSTFEYLVPMQREVYDYFDMNEFLKTL